MNRETARQEIRSRINCTDYLEKSKSGLYCCPYCGSGTGSNGTGAVKYYPETNTFYCHACKRGGDVIDLYQHDTGTDYNTALSLLAQEIGVTIDPYRPTAAADFAPAAKTDRTGGHRSSPGNIETPPEAKAPENGVKTPTAANVDFTGYYQECRERITDPAAVAYLRSRGISPETAAAYWLGFDPAADPANAPGGGENKPHPCPRIIIPTSKTHYIGRSIDPDTPKAFSKLNPKDSTPAIFNARSIYAQDVQEVFVFEGAFDALSALQAGAVAISLNSAGNGKILLEQLTRRRSAATFILCRDNDPDPKTAERIKKEFDELAAGLRKLNISFISADVNGGYKDANEHLTGNRTAFFEAIAEAQRQAAARPDNTAYYIDALMSGEIERFKNDKKTGFNNLDAQAGGLYSGLYVLAAISSLGKTSFALQLADQLAERGNDVLFFSMEQSRLELVSKSLARRTAQADKEKAVTSLSIRKGYLPRQVLDAAQAYKAAVADRLSIIEGNFACDISFIGDYIRRYVQRTGTRPTVFIDYLQILQPAEDSKRQTTKETIDSTVTELKRISRELDLTVVIISSVNRANYLTPIDFESLKESGGIEFTADVIWGLQLQCLNDPLFDKQNNIKERREKIKEAKAADPRKIELCCLKNRYGIANYSCYFDYYPANDLFTETSGAEIDFTPQRKAGRKL